MGADRLQPEPPEGISGDLAGRIPDGEPIAVPVELAGAVFRAVGSELPAGYLLTFNRDERQAWFRGSKDVDLATIISRAVGTAS
mgnify:CR=1 FL=1